MKFLRANHKIDMRQTFQERFAASLSHTTEEPKHYMRPLFRHLPQHTHFTERLLISHVAHTAGVQQHHISCRFVLGWLVTARHERMRDLFGVAFVHLAPVSLDEKFWHVGMTIIHGWATFVQDTAYRFLAAHINCTVILSATETSLAVALFAESKMI